MKFVKIKHYYIDDESYPWYIISMDDGKDYLSHWAYFFEATPSNLCRSEVWEQANAYGTESSLDKLFASRSHTLDEIKNASHMFRGSDITEFTEDMPNCVISYMMFRNCSVLYKFVSNMPKMEAGESMFEGCTSLTTVKCHMPKLISYSYMFGDCNSLIDKELTR